MTVEALMALAGFGVISALALWLGKTVQALTVQVGRLEVRIKALEGKNG